MTKLRGWLAAALLLLLPLALPAPDDPSRPALEAAEGALFSTDESFAGAIELRGRAAAGGAMRVLVMPKTAQVLIDRAAP